MERKRIYKDIVRVVSGRGATLLSNVAVGFFLPRCLGLTGYAYFRIFALYFTYTALLHLGFIDGLLLRYAGRDYDSLDKREFCAYTRFFAAFQFIVGAVLCIISIFIHDKEYSFIIMMIGIDTFLNSMTLYYMYISQATKRFKEYSFRSIVSAFAKLVLVMALFIMYINGGNEISYRVYLVVYVAIDFVLLLWYVYTYRDLTFGDAAKLSEVKHKIIDMFKAGFVLMIAYQVAHLVFVLDNQFVNVFYDTDTFGIYAFAYSIITAISSLISSTSAVLLPMLKSVKSDNAMRYYDSTLIGVTCVAGLSMVLMFPLEWFIGWFLPKYTDSLVYLQVVMPSLMLSACISVVMFTFYKVLDKQSVYLFVGLGTLAVGFCSNAVAQWIWASPYAISWASLFTLMVWYVLASLMFIRKYGHRPVKNILYILLVSALFYVLAFSGLAWWASALIYTAVYAAVTVVFYRKAIKNLIERKSK